MPTLTHWWPVVLWGWPEMTKPAAPKMQAGRRNVASILKQAVHFVAYALASLALVAAVSSCTSIVGWTPFDCNIQPGECE